MAKDRKANWELASRFCRSWTSPSCPLYPSLLDLKVASTQAHELPCSVAQKYKNKTISRRIFPSKVIPSGKEKSSHPTARRTKAKVSDFHISPKFPCIESKINKAISSKFSLDQTKQHHLVIGTVLTSGKVSLLQPTVNPPLPPKAFLHYVSSPALDLPLLNLCLFSVASDFPDVAQTLLIRLTLVALTIQPESSPANLFVLLLRAKHLRFPSTTTSSRLRQRFSSLRLTTLPFLIQVKHFKSVDNENSTQYYEAESSYSGVWSERGAV